MLTADHNELLKSVSRSFYLSMRFLPAGMREPVSLGYLIARLTDTIADAKGINSDRRRELLDSVRLLIQGQLDRIEGLEDVAGVLSHAGEAELIRQSPELFRWYQSIDSANQDHLSEVILTIIHGQLWDANYFDSNGVVTCESDEELLRYTYWVAGSVGEFWTKVGFTNLGERFAYRENASRMLICGRKLGQALQLVNILRDLHEDLAGGRCYLPGEELRQERWVPAEQVKFRELEPVFYKWVAICQELLEAGDEYCLKLRSGRVHLCTRLPQILAKRTLVELREAGPEQVMQHRIKVPRTAVWQSLVRALLF